MNIDSFNRNFKEAGEKVLGFRNKKKKKEWNGYKDRPDLEEEK